MAEAPDFDGYRKSYFVDPNQPLNPVYPKAVGFLMDNLLGLPGEAIDATPGATPLEDFVNNLARRMQGSRHFDANSMAQLHPNGFIPGVLANVASTLRNNNTIFQDVSPAETLMEQEAIRWIAKEIAGYNPDTTSGAITTGGTLANLTALTAARERLSSQTDKKGRHGWNRKTKAYILASEAAHYSIEKAAAILAPNAGIEVLKVPLEEGGFRMDPMQLERYVQALKKAGKPIMAIVGVAGETETGLVDNLDSIANIAERNGIFLHVDGAYGAPFRLTRNTQLFTGLERADSITVDPHKYMYTPYAAGSVLFRNIADHDRIEEMNKGGGAYVFQDDEARLQTLATSQQGPIKPPAFLGKRRIEGSMGGQGAAATWAVIHTLGRDGLRAILEHTLDVANHAYNRLQASDVFAPVFKPELNSICFYPDPTLQGNSAIADLLPYQAYTSDQDTSKNPRYEILQNLLIEEARQRLEERLGIYVTTTDLSVPVAGKGFTKIDRSAEITKAEKRKRQPRKPRVLRRLQKDNPYEERKYMKVFRLVPTHPYTENAHVDLAIDALHEIWRELLKEITQDTLPETPRYDTLRKFTSQAKESKTLEAAQRARRRNVWWLNHQQAA